MRSQLTVTLAISIVLVLWFALLAVPGRAELSPDTRICGQLKGPTASGRWLLTGKTLTGNGWTVFANGIPCSDAMKLTPGLLKQWARAKSANSTSDIPAPKGWLGCVRREKPFAAGSCDKTVRAGFEFWMTGPYTLAQLKAFKVLGH